MKNLYELTSDYENILNQLETAETEDEKEAALAALDEISGAIEQKAEIYAKIIKSKQAEADMYSAEVVRLAANKKAAENTAERLKARLLNAMQFAGIGKIPTAIGEWRIQNNPWSAEIVDESKVPTKYLIPQPPKVDKAQMIRDFKATGEILDGVVFEQKPGLRFR